MDWLTLEELNTLTNEEWTFLYGESVKNEKELRLETYHHSENFGHVRSFILLQIQDKKFSTGIILANGKQSSIDSIVSASELLDNNVEFFKNNTEARLHFVCNNYSPKNHFSQDNQYVVKEKREGLLTFSKEQEQRLFSWIQYEMQENFHSRFKNLAINSFSGFYFKHKEIDKLARILKKFDIFLIEKDRNDPENIRLQPKTAFLGYSLPEESYLSIFSELEHYTI